MMCLIPPLDGEGRPFVRSESGRGRVTASLSRTLKGRSRPPGARTRADLPLQGEVKKAPYPFTAPIICLSRAGRGRPGTNGDRGRPRKEAAAIGLGALGYGRTLPFISTPALPLWARLSSES